MGANASTPSPFSVLATTPPPISISRVHTSGHYSQQILLESLVSEATNFVVTHSDADRATAERTLEKFVNATLEDCYDEQTTWGWLYMVATPARATKVSYQNIWLRDQDGGLDPSKRRILSRYSMTMAGPPTDVLVPNPVVDAALPTHTNGWLNGLLNSQDKRPLSTGQIYRFTTGQKIPHFILPQSSTQTGSSFQ